MKLTFCGVGYVGLVSGVCFAESGHIVTCYDKDQNKIQKLQSGRSPIYEPGIDALIQRNVAHERLFFTDNLQHISSADAVFIAVGTPEGANGQADLSALFRVGEDLVPHLTKNMTLIIKSTVPVGTGEKLEASINEKLKHKGLRVVVASNPEFLAEGRALEDFLRPERIIVGVEDPAALEELKQIYKTFMLSDPTKMIVMDRRSAELTKYASNAMLASRISFMNELSRLSEKLGASIDLVRVGMGHDSRIGKKFLYAGPGYGGSCFPKDVASLIYASQEQGLGLSLIPAIQQANTAQKKLAFTKITDHFGLVEGKRFLVWGLAFKPGTDDVRDSPAEVIVRGLLEQGAFVYGHDPKAGEIFSKQIPAQYQSRWELLSGPLAAGQKCDGLILVTEWSEYRCPPWEKVFEVLTEDRVVFDFRNQWDRSFLEKQGCRYFAMGR